MNSNTALTLQTKIPPFTTSGWQIIPFRTGNRYCYSCHKSFWPGPVLYGSCADGATIKTRLIFYCTGSLYQVAVYIKKFFTRVLMRCRGTPSATIFSVLASMALSTCGLPASGLYRNATAPSVRRLCTGNRHLRCNPSVVSLRGNCPSLPQMSQTVWRWWFWEQA